MILHIGRVILVLLEVLIIFNLLIVVHEIGHFLAARWRGLYIEKFGIWFGKPLWKKKINGVQYSLGTLPFGGFVALPQLAPMDIIEGKADVDRAQLPPVSALDKIIVAIAGPLFSLLLAFAFAAIVWVAGYPVSESDMTTTVGYVLPESPAKGVLKPGDKILDVDGKRVIRFFGMNDSVSWAVVRSEGETIPIRFERNGEEHTVNIEPYRAESRGWFRRKSVRQLLILPAETALINKVEPNSPAAAAGLRKGDIIRAINGEAIFSPVALSEQTKAHPNASITLRVERGGATFDTNVKPVPMKVEGEKEARARIGIAWDTKLTVSHPSPIELVQNSVTSTFNTLGAVASRKSDVGLQHLSGPIGITRLYFVFLFSDERGWQLALWLSVLLNVNLAILNMLPIPVLDGGHILFGLIESIRRKPLNVRVLEVVQGACTLLIIGLLAYISFFDVQDWTFVKRVIDKYAPQSQKAKAQDVP